jgi:hypothetical protein
MPPMQRQALTPGAVLAGTYEVTRLLGEGGMGAVWEARHLRLERKRVAIKVLHGFVSSDGEAVNRFQREANIASRLGHPNIIQVHDFNNLENGAPYLVLEYLEGESLNERLHRGPMPLPQVLAIARQIGSALQATHNEGIVHRDLKPHNVFLCPSEAHGYATELVKVLDFGISKIQGSDTVKTQTNAILGTPQYMSPEQAKGAHRDIDHRTDVFALGAIVYEMLSGRAAFLGDSIPEVMFKVVYEEPPPLASLVPGLPPNVLAAVERALTKNHTQRCESAAAFIEALTGDPLNTLRGGPATATVHSPLLSSSLAAAAASRNQLPPARAASPEAFAATMATGDGRAHADAFGATVAPGAAGPGGYAPMGATAPQPHAAGGHTAMLPGHSYAPGLHGQYPAHAYDTAPVVDRPKHAPRRGLRFVAAGTALIAAMAIAFVVVRSMSGGPAGPTEAEPPASAGGGPAHAKGPDDPGPSVPTATPAGTDTSATDVPAQAPDAGTTARASNDGDGDQDGKRASDRSGGERDEDTRPSRGEEDLSSEMKQQLTEAEGMVESDPGAAISRARKILGAHPGSSRAAAVMVRAYCVKGDLGNANGGFGRVKSSRLRSEVRKFCKRESIDLRN